MNGLAGFTTEAATSLTVLEAKPSRQGLIICNLGSFPLFLCDNETAVLNGPNIRINAGVTYVSMQGQPVQSSYSVISEYPVSFTVGQW